ncbi:MAG: pantoate--beta-alanine ligase [Anaerolineae bacterium]|nr:pantoate--beta-alanine ligase [Anaerolineae bacterium]
MKICRTIAEVRAFRQTLVQGVGCVPTMGYLHAGHAALVQASQAAHPATIVTLFVNPAQFNAAEDLANYPRDEAGDLAKLVSWGVTAVFIPTVAEIYPTGYQTYIDVEEVSQGLEGQYRPGHFRGVATVVAKLLNIIQPSHAYFGQKDAQQVAVVRQMVQDLALPVEIMACPTVRESDGLALSSRNARLSPAERRAAPVLYRALRQTQDAYQAGERLAETLVEQARAIIHAEPLVRLEYLSLNDPQTLKPLAGTLAGSALLSLAAYCGPVRLIDNLLLAKHSEHL